MELKFLGGGYDGLLDRFAGKGGTGKTTVAGLLVKYLVDKEKCLSRGGCGRQRQPQRSSRLGGGRNSWGCPRRDEKKVLPPG